jgi:hypothetical protein
MNRALFVRTCAGAATLLGATASVPPGATTRRSLWVWQTPLSQAGAVATFAARNAFAVLFLSVAKDDRPALESGEGAAGRALRALRAGRMLYAVAGDPSWVEHGRAELPETMQNLLGAQRSSALFDGFALDIEPHTLPDWKDGSRKDELAENYVRLLGLIRAAAAALGLPVLATVHPTYAKYSPGTSGRSLLQRAAAAVDATDLMAYRNAESTLDSFGGESMQQLAALGKPWWLGVSTHSDSPPGTSYATQPAGTFFPAIDRTAADLAQTYGSSFAGIAVEDYRNTRALLGGG